MMGKSVDFKIFVIGPLFFPIQKCREKIGDGKADL
jgi:hypothetical protein